jgi:hypothetical protein
MAGGAKGPLRKVTDELAGLFSCRRGSGQAFVQAAMARLLWRPLQIGPVSVFGKRLLRMRLPFVTLSKRRSYCVNVTSGRGR